MRSRSRRSFESFRRRRRVADGGFAAVAAALGRDGVVELDAGARHSALGRVDRVLGLAHVFAAAHDRLLALSSRSAPASVSAEASLARGFRIVETQQKFAFLDLVVDLDEDFLDAAEIGGAQTYLARLGLDDARGAQLRSPWFPGRPAPREPLLYLS